MSTPKIIAVVFLSLFLAIALFIFGFLFSMKMTALNAGYVNSRLDSLPMASLVEEAEFDETIEGNPELVSLIKSVITENEAELKERTGETIDTIYGYFNGKSEDLDMALVLKDTILDPDFSISIIDKTDLTPLVKELVIEMTNEADLPYGLSIEPHIDDIANDLEPWLKEQASDAIPPIYDYVLGFRQNTDIVIQLEPVRETLRSYLKQDFLDSPPAEFAGLPKAELEQKFDEVFTEFAGFTDGIHYLPQEVFVSQLLNIAAGKPDRILAFEFLNNQGSHFLELFAHGLAGFELLAINQNGIRRR